MFCGSAFKNKGVQAMLDGVIDLLPSPADRPPVEGIDENDKEDSRQGVTDAEPFSALAFKIMTDPFVGRADLLPRLLGRARIRATRCTTRSRAKKERIGRILQMHANKRERDQGSPRRRHRRGGRPEGRDHRRHAVRRSDHVITLERMTFPEPVISMAVEPKTKSDQEKMGIALSRLAQEDPAFRVRTDEESGQTIIAGMGELHLDILVDRMKREFNVEANVGKPQVAYRETIRKSVEKPDYKHVKQSGGTGQYGHVVIELSPMTSRRANVDVENDFLFENDITGGVVPKRVHPGGRARASRKPCTQRSAGRLPGGGRQGQAASIGSYHDVDSIGNGVQDRRARWPSRKASRKANPVLLEPMMKVEVVTPEDYVGDVMGDLSSSSRSCCRSWTTAPSGKVINAMVPLGEMFGYATTLRSMTAGSRDVHDGVRSLRRSAEQHRRRSRSKKGG